MKLSGKNFPKFIRKRSKKVLISGETDRDKNKKQKILPRTGRIQLERQVIKMAAKKKAKKKVAKKKVAKKKVAKKKVAKKKKKK